MGIAASTLDTAILALPPVAATCTLWFKRRWHVALTLIIVAVLCWGLLLFSMSLDDAAAIEAFNRVSNHTSAEIEAFDADGASNAFAFLFGVPLFLLYGFLCLLVARAGQFLYRWYAHA